MYRKFKRLSIASQAAMMLTLMLFSTVSAFFFWANDSAIRAELSHSRTVADMADSFRTVAAKHGGFYVRREASDDVEKVGRFLAQFNAVKTDEGKQYVFHQKNPFLAIGDYSAAVQASPTSAKFRITSDNNFNPNNQPDAFDAGVLKEMRETSVTESWSVVDGNMRYARALRADRACLACHGKPEAAPKVVQAQYRAPAASEHGGGYGYEEGSIVGVTSVTVPHVTPLQMLASQSTGFWLSIAGVLGVMLFTFGMAVQGVVQPLKRLSNYANMIAESEDLKKVKGPKFDTDEHSSNNEIHREAFALKSLHESMQTAMDHINRNPGR